MHLVLHNFFEWHLSDKFYVFFGFCLITSLSANLLHTWVLHEWVFFPLTQLKTQTCYQNTSHCLYIIECILKYRGRQCNSYSMPWRALQGITFFGFFHSHLLFYFLSFSVHINKSSLVMGDVIWCRSPPQSELYASKRGPNLSEIARICQGAKYLGFVSSLSVKTRELSFAQFVYFLRKECLFFNFF